MAEKRLFQVQIETTIFVMARDENDAELVGRRYMREEEPAFIDSRLVTPRTTIDAGWFDGIPWGSDDDRTVAELVQAMKESATPPGTVDV